MLAWIFEKMGAEAIITKIVSEERRSPIYTEYMCRTFVLGGQPYTGNVVTARVGIFDLTFKTYAGYDFKKGQVLPVAELRAAVDPCRMFI